MREVLFLLTFSTTATLLTFSQSQQYSFPIISGARNRSGIRPGHFHRGQAFPIPKNGIREEGFLGPENGRYTGQDSNSFSQGGGESSLFPYYEGPSSSGFPPSRTPQNPQGESPFGNGFSQNTPGRPGPQGISSQAQSESQSHFPINQNLALQGPPDSESKSVSGDYCWEPFFSFCDTSKTILYCINGRCTCPTGWTLSPGNLPLNTVWDPASKRCLATPGSGCHPFPSTVGNGYVYCQPGHQCVPVAGQRDVGTCGAFSITGNKFFFLPLMMLYLSSIFLN